MSLDFLRIGLKICLRRTILSHTLQILPQEISPLSLSFDPGKFLDFLRQDSQTYLPQKSHQFFYLSFMNLNSWQDVQICSFQSIWRTAGA